MSRLLGWARTTQWEAACPQSLLFLQPVLICINPWEGDCHFEPRIVFWFINVFLNRKITRLHMGQKESITEGVVWLGERLDWGRVPGLWLYPSLALWLQAGFYHWSKRDILGDWVCRTICGDDREAPYNKGRAFQNEEGWREAERQAQEHSGDQWTDLLILPGFLPSFLSFLPFFFFPSLSFFLSFQMELLVIYI